MDINLKLPKELVIFDKELRSLIKKVVSRGQITAHIDLEFVKVKPQVKLEDLADIVDEILAGARHLGLSLSDDYVLQLAFKFYNPLVVEEDMVQAEEFKYYLFGTFEKALNDFIKSREEEGENLKRDILKNLETLEGLLKEVEQKKDALIKEQVERMKEKAKTLLGEGFENNPTLVNEIKLILEKSDINEEVERLKSHIELFKKSIDEGSPIGKKLEFIAQEMLREVNTMGNKLPSLFPLNVEMKTEIDKIRQQVANVE